MEIAEGTFKMLVIAVPPKSTLRVDTTLSLAINPATRDVINFQSPKPRGLNNGATTPDIAARMD